MSSDFEIMHMADQEKQYVNNAYEMLKENHKLDKLDIKDVPCNYYKRWNTREHMIFGEDYKSENYGIRGSLVRRFKGMNIVTAEALIAQGFLDPKETQNDSPTVREFIDFAKEHLDADFRFHGYAVGPERKDCRVSFDGIESSKDEISKETLLDFVKMFLVKYHADDADVNDDWLMCWYD